MASKQELIQQLREAYNQWEALLAGLSEEQITARSLPDGQSIKDIVGHLWAWQTRSVARMEAALNGGEPVDPFLPAHLPAEVDGQPNEMNAWIHEKNRDKPWAQVYGDWRTNFQRFLELCEAVPEADYFKKRQFPWLEDYPLAAVLEGSWSHHQEEHYLELKAWLERRPKE